MLTLLFNIEAVEASFGTIYIRADGSVDPTTAPIYREGDLYTLTGDIYHQSDEYDSAIVIERNNIILEGANHILAGYEIGEGVTLENRENVTITKFKIVGFMYCVRLSYSSNNFIIANNMPNEGRYGVGISLDSSSNYNTIFGNNITNNYYFGLSIGSSYNTISENNITNNNNYGVAISSSDNILTRNIISNNLYGIQLDGSNNVISENDIIANVYGLTSSSFFNSIFHNNFIDNNQQVNVNSGYVNIWDNGYPSGGNYWSDYTGNDADSDGIGDTPYVIDADNEDRYPLMEQWSVRTMTKSLIRTIEFWNLPKGTEKSLIGKLYASLNLLDRGNENGAIHKLMDFINQVEAQREKKLTNEQVDQLISEAQRIIDLIQE